MFVDRPLAEKDNALIVSNMNMDFETNQMLKESKDVKVLKAKHGEETSFHGFDSWSAEFPVHKNEIVIAVT